jgi:hypothetical protein
MSFLQTPQPTRLQRLLKKIGSGGIGGKPVSGWFPKPLRCAGNRMAHFGELTNLSKEKVRCSPKKFAEHPRTKFANVRQFAKNVRLSLFPLPSQVKVSAEEPSRFFAGRFAGR